VIIWVHFGLSRLGFLQQKHDIDVKYRHCIDTQLGGKVNVIYVNTDANPADIMTKGLGGEKHKPMLVRLGLSNNFEIDKMSQCQQVCYIRQLPKLRVRRKVLNMNSRVDVVGK
jgi:hypothetical protein